jgi:hypothetical protein
MPIYFFHTKEGDQVINDPEGIERPHMAAVQKAAIQWASSLIAEAVGNGDANYHCRINVEDESGRSVMTVTFASHVQIEIASQSGLG